MSAPAFGEEMFAAALGMGSFAVGTNIVPNDMVAQIHAGERIIPKADNDRLINLTALPRLARLVVATTIST